MAETYTRKYGYDFPKSWPANQIELYSWKHWREMRNASLHTNVEEHLYDACRMLFTAEQLVMHPWFEIQAHSWTYDTFAIWWGCAGSGKSHSLGLFTLLDFITDPDCTYAMLASTTKETLLRRSFASVVQYLQYLRANRTINVPFKYMPSKYAVVPSGASEDDFYGLKHMIVGVAVAAGTTQEAEANLRGVHTTYVRAVFDELSEMKPAAMESRHNLSQCVDFKLCGACNPGSIYDEAGKFSVPKARDGWASVDDNTDSWDSIYGRVYRFDARKSPGLKDPVKYPFLPTAVTIDRILASNNYNDDAPAVWSMLRAFPPPQGAERTILTETMVKSYGLMDTVFFRDGYTKVAAIDAAFTADGDNCIYQLAKVGYSVDGVLTIQYDRTDTLKILASDPRPVLEQIVDWGAQCITEDDVKLEHVAVDDSGTQSVADALAMRLGNRLQRFNYSNRPPDIPVSVTNPTLASKKYRNVATWLYYLVKEYAERRQIKGLPHEAARQMCLRRVGTKQQPHMIESKKEHKKRLKGRSPDEGDVCAMVAGIARLVLGIAPGATEWTPGGAQPPPVSTTDMQRIEALNNLESVYSEEDAFSVDSDMRSVV